MPEILMDYGTECTPQQRVQALEKSFLKARPGDVVRCTGDVYEAPRFPAIPAGVTVLGERGKTIWRTPWSLLVDQATSIELGDNCSLDSITIESTAEKNKQSVGIGFGTPSTLPRLARLRRLMVRGFVWGAYNWHGPANTLDIQDCDFVVARIGITGGRSDGIDAQNFRIENTRIVLDESLSTQGGSVTHPQWGGQAGLLMRGGRARITTLTVTATGPKPDTGPRVVAVTDWLDLDSATQVEITIESIRTALKKNGAQELWDVDMRYGKLRTQGGPWTIDWVKRELSSTPVSYGSGRAADGRPNGAVTVCPLAPLPKPVKVAAADEAPLELDPDVALPWQLQEAATR